MRYFREGLYDGAVFFDTAGQFDVAEDFGATEATEDDVGCGDLLDAGWSDGDSEAGTDESQDGQPLRRFLYDARAEAVFFAERDRLFPGEFSGGGGEEDEGLIAEMAGGEDAARCQGMIGGQDGDEGFGEEGFDGKALGWVAVAEEACVERAVDKALHDDGGVGLVQLEVHLRVCPAVLAEHGRERRQHAGADEAYAQEAYFATAYAAGFFEIFVDILQGAARAVEKYLTGAGEPDGSRGADEESVAEDLFEFADLLGERRLGEMETVGGAAEV